MKDRTGQVWEDDQASAPSEVDVFIVLGPATRDANWSCQEFEMWRHPAASLITGKRRVALERVQANHPWFDFSDGWDTFFAMNRLA